MPRDICPIYRTDTVGNAWTDIRTAFGPNPINSPERYLTDMSEWTSWAISNGVDVSDANKFGKWLIWLIMYGTVNYGNLPSNKKHDHVGKCWFPCPFDSNCYNATRSKTILGYTPTSLVDHGNFYMKAEYRGSWGMECTYSGCSYLIEYGHPYFYI